MFAIFSFVISSYYSVYLSGSALIRIVRESGTLSVSLALAMSA